MKLYEAGKSISRFSACLVATSLFMAPSAHAATQTDTFQVLLEIQKSCSVTAGSNIDLGDVVSTDTNIAASNTINVTCTKGTPYYIGLAPSLDNGGNDAGLGSMASTSGAGNADTVPYQLRQAAGLAGSIWGNTATDASAGNGVGATGTGAAKPHTVYATVASANFTADTYADTVTVTINY